jgi:hypothetical protein
MKNIIKHIVAMMCVMGWTTIAGGAVSVSFQFDNTVQWASDSGFTQNTGTSTIVGNTVAIPGGDYFRLNMSVLVTNNPNPASGGAWDQNNGTTQPPNLGVSGWGMWFTDSDASVVAPLVDGGNAVVAFPNGLYGVSSSGSANAANGNVGSSLGPVSGGISILAVSGSNPSAFPLLTLGAGAPQDIFTGLTYRTTGLGSAVLTTELPRASGFVAYFIDKTLGDATDAPTYTNDIIDRFNTTDILNIPAPLTVVVPEPCSAILLLLSSSFMITRRRSRTPNPQCL